MKLEVHIIPNASRDEVSGWTDGGMLKVRIQAPPVEGAANKRLVRFLAKAVGVSKSKVRIVRGETSRVKLLEIDGNEQKILTRLREAT